ncbi:hypothetical protein [Novosphingopyxis sp.]|uniref:hypothetical protein n=1 Tax=Novosphingopyxis sp. TaxID=2709690 RepID=UPI003B5C4490
MRFKYLTMASAAFMAAAASMPMAAGAQDVSVPSRLDRIEQEVRALQRKVFPGGSDKYFEPEIQAQQPPRSVPGTTGDTSTVGNLMARVDALEGQLASLTGQVEERGYQLRQLETQLKAMQDRLAKLEAAPAAVPVPEEEAPAATAAENPARPASAAEKPSAVATASRQQAVAAIERPSTGDAAEDSYVYGYRLWEAGFFPEAQVQLAKTVKDYPKAARVSYARNLLGRAWLDDKKPATSAQHFLENYQQDPRGDRAPDSLYFLGVALTQLDKKSEACQAYAELADVYPDAASGRLADRVASGKAKADCK